jgi:isoleucyl-tRNA synthetase
MSANLPSPTTPAAPSGVPNFPELEEALLAFWDHEKIFQRSLEQTRSGKRFVFYEGPPYANGQPGIHHMLARSYKDAVARFKTMQGFFVGRKAGWDTHGLPTEMAVEKLLGLRSKREIEERIGIERFVEECRKNVFLYKGEWERFTRRIGYWVDLDDAYVTMTNPYIESVWWIFRQIWDRGFLYQDYKVTPHCPRCGTSLSSHELAQGYQDVTDQSVIVKFELLDKPKTFVLAWTTTPWTLPGNVGLAISTKIRYVRVAQGDEQYILAEERLSQLEGDYEVLGEVHAKDLLGQHYRPLFPGLDLGERGKSDAYRILSADFVTIEDGTGVVHTAVMYGEDDFHLGQSNKLPTVHTVDERGHYMDFVPKWAGRYVRDVEPELIADLRERGLLYKEEPYRHSYPFCWRCGTALLYYAKTSWFIRVSAVRKQLLAANENITWVPEYIKQGRFGEWLSNVQDWAISRERYWGVPLPIWVCGKGHKMCIGSYDELRQHMVRSGDKGPESPDFDPHRPYIDATILRCPECGESMNRVSEVADVWFDSGSMPWAQWHYPFEHRELVDSGEAYPADFIAEGIDQTRGWFYTMLAVATLLGQPAPYHTVVSLGLINDKTGQKMSKSKGNLIVPAEMIERYGADAVRFYLYTVSNAGDFKNFDPTGVSDVIKRTFLILWNVVSFTELTRPDDTSAAREAHQRGTLDRWLLSQLQNLVQATTERMEQQDLTAAGRGIADFITLLSTWYVRRSRERMKHGSEEERVEAAATLSTVLTTLAKLLAPLTPFLAESLWQRLGHKDPISVHLSPWPVVEKRLFNEDLDHAMDVVRGAVELGHAMRAERGVRVRQPLAQFVLAGVEIPEELLGIMRDELNVQEVHLAKELPRGGDWAIRGQGKLNVALDLTITDELSELGLVRDVVRLINEQRKRGGFTTQDYVIIHVASDDQFIRGLVERYGREIAERTQAKSMTFVEALEGEPQNLAGHALVLEVKPAP